MPNESTFQPPVSAAASPPHDRLRIAAGEPLPRRQDEICIEGAAIEARLYAENPTTGLLPSTGPVRHWRLPEGIRCDSGIEQGGEMTGFYDPLMAKLIVHAPSRAAAARELARACAAVEVWPVHSNAAFLARVAAHPAFIAGDIDTGFIARYADALIPAAEPDERVLQAAAGALVHAALRDGADPWTSLVGFRANAAASRQVAVEIDDRTYLTGLAAPANKAVASPAAPDVTINGERVLFLGGTAWRIGVPTSGPVAAAGAASDGALRSPMPGRVVSVSVRDGQAVTRGQILIAVEAMKMEHALLAPFDGVVAELRVAEGDQVAENALLARVASVGAPP